MTRCIDDSLESSGSSDSLHKNRANKLITFGAATMTGLLTGGQVDADIIHTGPAAGAPIDVDIPPGYGYRGIEVDIDLNGSPELYLSHQTDPGFILGFNIYWDAPFRSILMAGTRRLLKPCSTGFRGYHLFQGWKF